MISIVNAISCATDSAMSATSEMNDIQLNGETDDEVMENGETGYDDGSAAVRSIRDAGHPTGSERREHMNTQSNLQIMMQVLCDGTWCEFATQEIRCS